MRRCGVGCEEVAWCGDRGGSGGTRCFVLCGFITYFYLITTLIFILSESLFLLAYLIFIYMFII